MSDIKTIDELRDELCDQGMEETVIFENPDFASAFIGISADDRAVYDYAKMIQHLVAKDNMTPEEAADFIDYNTVRSLGYVEGHPVIVMLRDNIEVRPQVFRVYLSHAFGNQDVNRVHLEIQIKDMYKKYMDQINKQRILLVSPIHALGHSYDWMSYQEGLDQCFKLLSGCDLMVTFPGYDSSTGVRAEIDYCQMFDIPVMTVDQFIKDFLSIS